MKGMMTPTLLDVATMAGFRPCGDEVSALSPSKCEVDFGFTKKNKSYKVFMEANAQEIGPLTHKEHTAFLMIWLCKYVFCMASAQVTLEVQPLVEALAKGHRLALGPMVLAYLYRGLYNMVSLNPMNCNTTGPIWLFQLWLQVYFPEVRPAHDLFAPNSLIGTENFLLFLAETKFSSPADNDRDAFRRSLWASILLSRDLHLGLSIGTHANYPYGVEVYFPSAIGRQLGFTQAIPLPITESCNMCTSHRAKFKTKAECNVVSVDSNVAKDISSTSPTLPKKILHTKRNHLTMIGDSSSHSQVAALAKPKIVSRPKSLVICTGRKTSMTYESSSDEDDDGIAKAPTKRPKKDPVIKDLPDLSSPGHSQEFIGFDTEDQFDSPVDNTIIAELRIQRG
ncbi:unnamed protein product [Prunus armeniaca]